MFTRTPLRDKSELAGHTTPEDVGDEFRPGGVGKPRRVGLDELLGRLATVLEQLEQTSTAFAAMKRSQVVNGVLGVEKITFDSSGTPVQRQYNTAVGAVTVLNYSATKVTVAAGPASSAAPTSGVGVQDVPANCWLTVPIGQHLFAVYGSAGASVGIQVFTGGTGANGGPLQ